MTQKKDATKAAEARRLSKNLRALLMAYKGRLEEQLRAEGLTLAQLRLLKAIAEQSDVSAAALARTCLVTPQTLQAVLVRAEREGWIARGTNEHNRRLVTASLTELGAEVLEHGSRMAAAIEEKIWRGVAVRELVGMNELMERGLRGLEGEGSE